MYCSAIDKLLNGGRMCYKKKMRVSILETYAANMKKVPLFPSKRIIDC